MKIRVLLIGFIVDHNTSRPDAELVAGLHRQGVEIDVIIPAHSSFIQRFEELGIRVIPSYPRWKFSLRSILFIRNEIRKQQYPIIHLLNTKAIINGTLASVGLPVKVIAYRGAAAMYWHDPTSWLSHLNPRIDLMICNSYYVQQHMRRQLLLKPGKAVMIHKGMDLAWFQNVSPVARQELGIPDQAVLVGCVADMRRIKGVRYLIEAINHVNPELPVHILLIGAGMDSDNNLHRIESSPSKDRIHVLGFRKDVYSVLAACDIYIQPSLNESLSRSVMEAMCLGVPCIVSDIGGLLELVEHEKSGLVVERGNAHAIARAIEKLSGNPQLRKNLAGEAVNRMKQIFSVDNMVTDTLKIYKQVVS